MDLELILEDAVKHAEFGFISLENKGHLEIAVFLFDKLIEYDSNEAGNFEGRAYCKYQLENYHEAIKDLTTAIKLNSENSATNFHNRGLCKCELENYADAIEDFNEAIKIEPCDKSFMFRAGCNFQLGDYRGAIKDLTTAIKLDPKKAVSIYSKGVCLQQLGQIENAKEHYLRAIELIPNRTENPTEVECLMLAAISLAKIKG